MATEPTDAGDTSSDLDKFVKSLQTEVQQLNADKKALIEELQSGTDETNVTVVKEALLEQVPQFVVNIINLANAADSEAVRLSASRLGIEFALGGKLGLGETKQDKDFKKLFDRIKKDPDAMEEKAQRIQETRDQFEGNGSN